MGVRRILVTGASGFVGRHLVPMLRCYFPESELCTAAFDIADASVVREQVANFCPDVCFHLAAIASISAARESSDKAWAVNLHCTLHLAQLIVEKVRECALIFASSADAYGRSCASDRAVAPCADEYLCGDQGGRRLGLGAMVGEGLRVIRVRAFNHVGPGQSPAFVAAAFARQVARIRLGLQLPIIRVGALETRREFLDVLDMCEAYVACLRNADALAPGTVLNIGSGEPRPIRDLLDDLIARAGVPIQIETDPSLLRPSDVPVPWGDTRLAGGCLVAATNALGPHCR